MRASSTLTILFLVSLHSYGADMIFNSGVLELSGEIEKGDYDKFMELIIQRETIPITVYLDSSGGDVSEAIKIGNLKTFPK